MTYPMLSHAESQQTLQHALDECRLGVYEYLKQPKFETFVPSDILQNASYRYIDRMGKALRPALVLWSAELTGGEERAAHALPAAAAVEVFHTFSLIHDDIIDQDDMRRDGPTVHVEYEQYARDTFGLSGDKAAHFGTSVALLAGDVLLTQCIGILTEYFSNSDVLPEVAQHLLELFTRRLIPTVIAGEMRDVAQALAAPAALTEEQVLQMYYEKTAVTLEIAVMIGGMIGTNRMPQHSAEVRYLAEFGRSIGVAFQLQDDLLGLVGSSQQIGKTSASDIYSGKRTVTAIHAARQAQSHQQILIDRLFSGTVTERNEVDAIIQLMHELGSIRYTQDLAEAYLERAVTALNHISNMSQRAMLQACAKWIIQRSK